VSSPFPDEEGLFEGPEGLEDDLGPLDGNRYYRPLTADEVKGAVSREILDSHGAISAGSQIAEERRQALKFFFGQPLGNEVEGRSQVVLTEVADTIHWIMPSLMRMFASGEDVFEFQPTGPEDIDQARQATEFINHVFWHELDGFSILYDWFFTALLEKNGFVVVEWEDRVEPKIESYRGLSEQQLQLLLSDGRGLEPIEFEEFEEEIGGQPMKLFNVTVRQVQRLGRVCVRGIPPEEFLIARRTIRLDDDVHFVGERRKMTASSLIALGFDPDEVHTWPTDETPEFTQGRTIRLSEEETFPIQTADRPDAASREMWVNNVYMRIDEDGDGYAELRHLMTIGDTSMELISDEYAEDPPFASLTASPVAHKFFGQSVVDLVGDLQIIRTTLMRQMLDNLYLQNNQRTKVVRGEVEMSDLFTSRPGGVVRVDSLDSMEPIVTPQLPAMAMGMMEYLDQIRETRVGVSRFMQGLDASSLSGTATGVNALVGASQQRIELIGRIFSKTGMKRLGKLLLRTYARNNTKSRVIRLRGEWVEFDPSSWNTQMDCQIRTGLGVGSSAERIGYLMAMINLQKEALLSGATFMVKPQDLYRAVEELSKTMGFSRADRFFSDPGEKDWPEPPPDTKVLENQRRVQDDQRQAELELERIRIEAQKEAEIAAFRREELAQKRDLELKRIEAMIEAAKLRGTGGESNGGDGDDG